MAIALEYSGTSLIGPSTPLGPYSRSMLRALWWSTGGEAVSYERGIPVLCLPEMGIVRTEFGTTPPRAISSTVFGVRVGRH